MRVFDWAMVWTLILFIINEVGLKSYAMWQILLPMIIITVLGLVGALAGASDERKKKGR